MDQRPRGQIVRCCRALLEAGLIAGVEGNVSVRLAHDRVLVTPRGLLKSELGPEDLVEVDLAGRDLNGYREATTELDLPLRAYRQRTECGAVVHGHPPTATAFAVAGEGLPGTYFPKLRC
jgi:L-fuculose-phosphate aldolase